MLKIPCHSQAEAVEHHGKFLSNASLKSSSFQEPDGMIPATKHSRAKIPRFSSIKDYMWSRCTLYGVHISYEGLWAIQTLLFSRFALWAYGSFVKPELALQNDITICVDWSDKFDANSCVRQSF